MEEASADLQAITTEIICAYVANNQLTTTDLPELIVRVRDALAGLGQKVEEPALQTAPVPAVPLKKSIHPDYIVCLEDGGHFKTLKRHLRVSYGMTPEQYRAKWDLPFDYPMVAPNYARSRSEMAKSYGFGKKPEAKPRRRKAKA